MKAISKLIRGNQMYFEDFVTRSTYHSNAIEGNTLSYAETYAILFQDNRLTIRSTARELHQAINHKYAIDYMLRNLEEPLSERIIKCIAMLINKNINDIVDYRKGQVFIQGAEHIPPAPASVGQMMTCFVDNDMVHGSVFEKVAAAHIEFERIHPFEDGNGRTGRLLINYELMKNELPPIVILKNLRTEYFEMIANQDAPQLAKLIEQLSNQEQKRMMVFQEK